MDTRETVAEFLQRRASGDIDRIMEMVAEPADFRSFGTPVAPWLGTFTGRTKAREFFTRLFAGTQAKGATVDAILVDGAEAVVLGDLAVTVVATGRTYKSPFVLRLTVRDGKIVRHHVFEDSLALHQAMSGQ
ncbi:MAG: nuclear transport factor 2 family protein [Corynebacteriales bacterium]|nr:nuclear transport factor 2 family protein [Mycobacteriales bacterium]